MTIRSVLIVRSYWLIAIAFVFMCMVHNVHDFWLARYYVEAFEMTNEQAGQFATLWSKASTIVGLLLGGYLADRWARLRHGGRTLVQVIGMVVWTPSLVVLSTCTDLAVLKLAMIAIDLGYGFYGENLWTTTFEVIDPAARSTAVGLLNVIGIGGAPPDWLLCGREDSGTGPVDRRSEYPGGRDCRVVAAQRHCLSAA